MVQGPPGTGKSQTIINIIANNLVQGKKTAVISQKKQALQVIVQKMADVQLSKLCMLIFEGNDKKNIVQDVKDCFEQAYKSTYPLQKIEEEQQNITQKITDIEIKLLQFHETLTTKGNNTDIPIYTLLQESFSIPNFNFSGAKPTINFSYNNWVLYGNAIEQYFANKTENELLLKKYFSKSVFQNFIKEGNYNNELHNILEITNQVVSIQNSSNTSFKNLEEAYNFYHQFSKIPMFQESIFVKLLNQNSDAFKSLKNENKELALLEKELIEQKTKNAKWYSIPTKQIIDDLLDRLTILDKKYFPYFTNEFIQIKIVFAKYFNGYIGGVKRAISLLKQIKNQLNLAEKLENYKAGLLNKYHYKNSVELQKEFEIHCKNIDENALQHYQNIWDNKKLLANEIKISQQFLLLKSVNALFNFSEIENINQLQNLTIRFQNNYNSYASYFPVLNTLYKADENFQNFVFNAKSASEIKEALLKNALIPVWESAIQQSQKIDIEKLSEELLEQYNLHHKINAIFIKAKQHHAFMHKYTLGLTSVSQLNEQETAEREKLKAQHQFLQNEFAKQKRFKTIEEFLDQASVLLQELKPVCLLKNDMFEEVFANNPKYFDTVIFDESSQIPLVEAQACLQHAKQIIIVGDSEQLPPTTFFATKEEQEMKRTSLLDAYESILPNIHLNWHYRSIDERLIAFNNEAFYNGSLLTFPNNKIENNIDDAVVVKYPNQAFQFYQKVYKKPLSFHYVQDTIYKDGTNTKEAQYIAELVKQLLLYNNKFSIGVVAFSIEQKNEIQNALSKIDFFDQKIDELLELKKYRYKNYEDFIVRNLENVQGDEKDIIIVSTTYAYDSEGKLNLNLGPINKEHGTKRLNVLFSRARKHMVVVSSLYGKDIETNNENISLLKKYLDYAQIISEGSNVLSAFKSKPNSIQFLIDDIKLALEKRGHKVDVNIGYSSFKCHLAIKGKTQYDLGILLDDDLHYQHNNIYENYVQKQQLLQERNWNMIRVYTANWIFSPEDVLTKIEMAIENPIQIEKAIDNKAIALEDKFDKKEKQLLFTRLIKQGKQTMFWEIAIDNMDVIILYGKLDHKGTKLIKRTESVAEAITLKRKLTQEKLKNDYKWA